MQLYTSAGIPEYWIVSLHKPQFEVHRDPDSDEARYWEVHTLAGGEAAEPLGLEWDKVVW